MQAGTAPIAVRRVALAVNPTSGRGRGLRFAAPAAGRLRAAGVEVVEVTGRDGNEASDLMAAAVAEGVDAVVVVGGDGMVHLALQHVAGTGIALGLVPAGTGNDLANLLGLPLARDGSGVAAAADVVIAGHVAPLDAARTQGSQPRWWLNVLGAGFDSAVNERANRMRWPKGPRRYELAMVAELRVFRPLPFTLTLDEETVETEAMLVTVGNGVSYGAGMRVCPDARIDDGLLDVTLTRPVSKATLLRMFPSVYRGAHVRHPAVSTFRSRTVGLACPGVTAYADGERFAALPVTSECVQGAVRFLVPASARSRRSL